MEVVSIKKQTNKLQDHWEKNEDIGRGQSWAINALSQNRQKVRIPDRKHGTEKLLCF